MPGEGGEDGGGKAEQGKGKKRHRLPGMNKPVPAMCGTA